MIAHLRSAARLSAHRLRSAVRGHDDPPEDGVALDAWLTDFWGPELARLDARCAAADDVPWEAFRELDSGVWAALLTQAYDVFPNIRAALPEVPAPSLQATWNGTSGVALAAQGIAFYELARELHARYGPVALADARVLDFGCGWGRLTRMFARDVALGRLFGCDPVAVILDVCRDARVPATLARSEFVPERLPFEDHFELIYAFSVFTHLSERAHRACLHALHDGLAPGGLLVLTVRPRDYLQVSPLLAGLATATQDTGSEPSYLFAPHPSQPFGAETDGGEITYGETVISPEYIRRHWTERFELLGFHLLLGDPHQVVVALRARG